MNKEPDAIKENFKIQIKSFKRQGRQQRTGEQPTMVLHALVNFC
jgi:hypothetical protein